MSLFECKSCSGENDAFLPPHLRFTVAGILPRHIRTPQIRLDTFCHSCGEQTQDYCLSCNGSGKQDGISRYCTRCGKGIWGEVSCRSCNGTGYRRSVSSHTRKPKGP